MKSLTLLGTLLTFAVWGVASLGAPVLRDYRWKKVDRGLWVGEFDSPLRPWMKESKITAVKISPNEYAFKLLCASEHQRRRRTAREWCENHGLVLAVNAGMYQEDGIRHVGYMRNFGHVNNGRLNSTYKTVLAFNRVEPSVPEVQIIDLQCQDFEKLKNKYDTLIQNIRMINCRQENVWSQQDRMSGMAALGMDREGDALFLFSEAPYTGHDFIHILLSLPLSIYNAMYLEGGPEANLYLSAEGVQLERVGRLGGIMEGSTAVAPRPIPNVIGIVKK